MNDKCKISYKKNTANILRFLGKLSAFIPVIFIALHYYDMDVVYIKEISCRLLPKTCLEIYLILTLLWLVMPTRKYFRNSGFFEILYNLCPTELFLLLYFAQKHFWLSCLFAIVSIALLVFVLILNVKNKKRYESKKEYRKKKRMIYQSLVLCICVMCATPSFLAAVVYKLQGETYIPTAETDGEKNSEDENVTAENTEQDAVETVDVFEENKELLLEFTQENWEKKSIQERIDVAQRFLNFEDIRLGIPSVPIYAEKMYSITVIATYDYENKNIIMDNQFFMELSAEEILNTLCEENFHAFECYMIENMDWNMNLINTYYFQELREWRENLNCYISAGLDDYEEYESQPVEASAKRYAKEETELIQEYLKKWTGSDIAGSEKNED